MTAVLILTFRLINASTVSQRAVGIQAKVRKQEPLVSIFTSTTRALVGSERCYFSAAVCSDKYNTNYSENCCFRCMVLPLLRYCATAIITVAAAPPDFFDNWCYGARLLLGLPPLQLRSRRPRRRLLPFLPLHPNHMILPRCAHSARGLGIVLLPLLRLMSLYVCVSLCVCVLRFAFARSFGLCSKP